MSCAKSFFGCLFLLLIGHVSLAEPLPENAKVIIDWHRGQQVAPMILQHSGILENGVAVGTVNQGTSDTAFLTTPVGLLDEYRRYLLTVTYRVLESSLQSDQKNARSFFAMRTRTPNTTWVPSTWIIEPEGQQRTRIIDYLLPDGIEGYTFNIGVEKEGRLAVDAVKLVAMPRIIDGRNRDITNLPTPDFKNRPYEPFGMCQHMPWRYFYKTDQQIKDGIAKLKQMGVQSVRIGITWQTLQPKSKEQWDQAMIKRYDTVVNGLADAGMKIHTIVHTAPRWTSTHPEGKKFWRYMPKDMEALQEYIRFVTKRYGKHIESYEIANEPDLQGFWMSSIEDYMDWSKVIVKVIRTEDPTAVVLSGSLTDAGLWGLKGADSFALQTMIDNGLGQTFDGLAVHTYTPQTELAIYQMNHWYSQLVRAGLGHMPLWITEVGRSTYTNTQGVITTQQDQADILYKTYTQLAQHPAVEKIFWYNFREKAFLEKSSPREAGFGLVQDDFTPKLGYEVYRTLPKLKHKQDNMQFMAVDRQRFIKD